jgi:hypothetical protein
VVKGLDVTPYDPKPGTEETPPIDSTPVGQFTNGIGNFLSLASQQLVLLALKPVIIHEEVL